MLFHGRDYLHFHLVRSVHFFLTLQLFLCNAKVILRSFDAESLKTMWESALIVNGGQLRGPTSRQLQPGATGWPPSCLGASKWWSLGFPAMIAVPHFREPGWIRPQRQTALYNIQSIWTEGVASAFSWRHWNLIRVVLPWSKFSPIDGCHCEKLHQTKSQIASVLSQRT